MSSSSGPRVLPLDALDDVMAAGAQAILTQHAPVPAPRALLAMRGKHGAGVLLARADAHLGAHEGLGKVAGILAGEKRICLGGHRELGPGGLRGLLGDDPGGLGALVGLGKGRARLDHGRIRGKLRLVLVGGHGCLVPVEKRRVGLAVPHRGRQVPHGLVGRVGQDRLQVMDEHGEDLRPYGEGAPALETVPAVAVDAILGGVEIAVRELGHVVVEQAEHHVEAIASVGLAHRLVHLAHVRQHEAIVREQLGRGDGIGGGIELALDLAEEEAEGVADLAVRLTHAVEDRVVAGHVG